MNRSRLSLPEAEWPAADLDAWRVALEPAGIFDEASDAGGWRPSTVTHAKYAYGQWLRFLQDFEPSALGTPHDARLTEARVRDFVKAASARLSPSGLASMVGHFVLAMRAIAPGTDYAWLQRLQNRHLRMAKPRDKRALMVSTRELVVLGNQLMDSSKANGGVEDVLAYRDGLIIAILASRPMRRGNFASMRLDRHVKVAGSSVLISFDEYEMKGGRAQQYWLPELLVPPFIRYVSSVRVLFPRADAHQFVWCSMKGGRLTADGLYQMVVRRTRQAFGEPINPHLFRDIAATSFAIERPDQVLLSKDLLGHASMELTERHYLHAQSAKATRGYAKLIASLRGG